MVCIRALPQAVHSQYIYSYKTNIRMRQDVGPYNDQYISGLAKKNTRILYTCGRFPYMSVHISVYILYTVCNRRYTGRYVEGVYTEFFSCGRIPYMSVHISVYIMYTTCNRRNTGRHVEGVYKEFTVVVEFLLVQARRQYTVCILGESWGILNVV